MFTGLVSAVGEITAIDKNAGGARLLIAQPKDWGKARIGASISVSGACMTVTDSGVSDGADWFACDVSLETLARTTLKDWRVGMAVNLERPLRLQDELGGHMVTGHVDGTCRILSIAEEGTSRRIHLEAQPDFARFIAPKGSVALNGVSLTVNGVEGRRFDIVIIPHTWQRTNWRDLQEGDEVNLEVDILARHLERLAEASAMRKAS